MATATFSSSSDDPRGGPSDVTTSPSGEPGDELSPLGPLDSFSYDDGIARMFATATVVWGGLATLFGLLGALLLVLPELFYPLGEYAQYLSFGRLRPLHTNVGLYAFIGNGLFAAVYYSTQRLCKTPMWSGVLSRLHFWSWQAIIVAAAATTPLGITQGKEFSEWEWPLDVAIAVVWVLFFGLNFFMTLAHRRERYLYISLWFYIASIVTITIVHIFSNLVVTAGWDQSYPASAGVVDAFLQGWYGHNLTAFLMIMPFLGLMYYFLPKATNRPIYSYKLAILNFWGMVILFAMAAPRSLHYTPIPEWASTFGMLFGLMLLMPAWAGLINGLGALREGALREGAPGAEGHAAIGTRLPRGPVVGFFAVALLCYGIYTLEGALLSIKSVAALVQYSDWTIAHMHTGTLGWNGMLSFGMLYWMLPRLFQTELWSPRMAVIHFWFAILGILLYLLPIYAAGLVEAVMWNHINETGRLANPEFLEVLKTVVSLWWIRVLGGTLYVIGVLMLGLNYVMTWAKRPSVYAVPVVTARRLVSGGHEAPAEVPTELAEAPMLDLGRKLAIGSNLGWHHRWERHPTRFALLVTAVIVVASLLQIAPLLLFRSTVPPIAGVQPYTPLELAGREIYIAEGCINCHSQMVRPLVPETQRYGEFSRPGEFVYDRPAQWGSRRIGPDLARVGGRQSDHWHWLHLEDPRQETVRPGSVMPSFAHLLDRRIDFEKITERVAAAEALGVPYDRALTEAPEMAHAQAERVAAEIVSQGGPFQRVLPSGERILVMDTQAVALIAYLQRLGTDFLRPAPAEPGAEASGAEPEAAQPSGKEAAEATVEELEGVTTAVETGS